LSARYVDLFLLGPLPRQPFLGSLPRGLGSLNVDLLDPFGRLGQHRNLLAPDLDKTAADGHLDLVAVLLDKPQTPYLQRGQKRYVSGEDAKTPLATGHLQAGDLPRVSHPLWRDDL
jgi:hypothetical protein